MKNKLLVSVFATAIAVFAFTSCESKSDVTEVCTDLTQKSLHKSARSLLEVNGETLTISEYEFASSNVNDNRLVYRTITFGNGKFEPKKVENLTYQYGDWNEDYTKFSLLVTPATGAPYTLWYGSNALQTSDGRLFGGEGTANTARVEKWEKTLNNFLNTDWEGVLEENIVLDSVMMDSVYKYRVGGKTYYDTIKVWTGEMATTFADSTVYTFDVKRDASSLANTGHYVKKFKRYNYNKETKEKTFLGDSIIKEYDYTWYFSEVSSDSKFSITLKSTTSGVEGDVLGISKYKLDTLGAAAEFLLDGVTYKRP